jgi:putative heme-binding domain-containing protein
LAHLIQRDFAIVLRDTRDPAATIHPDYVTQELETTDGQRFMGFLRPAASASADAVTLADAEGQVRTWTKASVLRLTTSTNSLMPSGLLDGTSTNDVRDLLTYLIWEVPTRTRAHIAQLPRGVAPMSARPPRLVLVAGKQDHGPGQHDYPAWQEKWLRLLRASVAGATVEKAWDWPSDEQFEQAGVMVFYFWNHDWNERRLAALDRFQARGGGVVVLHSAVISDTDAGALAQRIGMAAHPRISYRHMPFELELTATPLTRGLPERLRFLDEPYWPLIGDISRIQPLGWARVDGERRPLVWTFERGPGRVFGSILGHYFWTLDDPLYRLLVLRGIAWAAGAEIDSLTDVAALEARIRE